MKYRRKLAYAIGQAAILLALLIGANTARSDDQGNLGVVPPNSNEFGNPYGEWSARWWQWLLSIPEATNPNLGEGNVDCALAQTGPVWFLAGTFGGPAVTRNCTKPIPSGRDLLLTPLAGVFGELGPGPVSDCPGGPNQCDIQQIRALAAANVDNPQLLEVSVDGTRVPNVAQYRVTSPVFSAFLPDGAIAAIPKGLHGPLVSDGYFLLLQAPSPGAHTIHFKGIASASAGGFVIDVTYHLKVK
jgi:hypothetical protein